MLNGTGNVGPFMQIFLGVVLIVIAYVLYEVIIDQAATTTANANIGSFAGAAPISRLGVTVFAIVIVTIGIGLIGIGGLRAGGVLSFVAPVAGIGFGILPVLLGLAVIAGYQAYKAGAFRSFQGRSFRSRNLSMLAQARE